MFLENHHNLIDLVPSWKGNGTSMISHKQSTVKDPERKLRMIAEANLFVYSFHRFIQARWGNILDRIESLQVCQGRWAADKRWTNSRCGQSTMSYAVWYDEVTLCILDLNILD
jgi:hypothetical protein